MVLGQRTPMERPERLREYRSSSYRGDLALEKRKYLSSIAAALKADPAVCGLRQCNS